MHDTELDRRRSFTLRDLILLATLAIGLVANYVAISSRLAVLEAQVRILYDDRHH